MIETAISVLVTVGLLLASYFLSKILTAIVKYKLLKRLHTGFSKHEAQSFAFKLSTTFISPLIFVITTMLVGFITPIVISVSRLEHPLITQIPVISSSLISVALKLALIWFLYEIANLSSVGKKINRMVASFLVLVSLISFLGFNKEVVVIFDKLQGNFGGFEASIYKASLFILICIGIFWLNRIFVDCLRKMLDTSQVSPNIKSLSLKFFSIVLIIVAGIMGLSSIGFDIKSLAIFSSAVVVGLGFGLQKLVSNIISGIVISFEGILKEGDIVVINDSREIKGIVKRLNMRYTLVREFDGKEVIIPNDVIMTSSISNLTHSNNKSRIRVDLKLPHDIKLDQFIQEAVEMMSSLPYASKTESSAIHVEAVSEVGIDVFLLFWIDNPHEVAAAKTSLMFALLKYLKEKNIKIPEPIFTYYNK